MASGDLDGDIYWINWNEKFLENFIEQPPNTKEETPAKPVKIKIWLLNSLQDFKIIMI